MPPRGTLRVIDAAEEFVSIVNNELAVSAKNWPYTDQLRRGGTGLLPPLQPRDRDRADDQSTDAGRRL